MEIGENKKALQLLGLTLALVTATGIVLATVDGFGSGSGSNANTQGSTTVTAIPQYDNSGTWDGTAIATPPQAGLLPTQSVSEQPILNAPVNNPEIITNLGTVFLPEVYSDEDIIRAQDDGSIMLNDVAGRMADILGIELSSLPTFRFIVAREGGFGCRSNNTSGRIAHVSCGPEIIVIQGLTETLSAHEIFHLLDNNTGDVSEFRASLAELLFSTTPSDFTHTDFQNILLPEQPGANYLFIGRDGVTRSAVQIFQDLKRANPEFSIHDIIAFLKGRITPELQNAIGNILGEGANMNDFFDGGIVSPNPTTRSMQEYFEQARGR